MRIDFHVHTGYSYDSLILPRELAIKSRRLGIIPAVADHNSILAHEELKAMGADFIPADEYKTHEGDLIGLFVEKDLEKGIPALEAIDSIHGQGGLVYLPHMYDTGRDGIANEELAMKADIIEVFNARCMDSRFNDKAEGFAKSNMKPGAAGSDSHFLFEFGGTYTEVPDFDLDSPKGLMRALGKARLVKRRAPIMVRGTTTLVSIAKRLISRRL